MAIDTLRERQDATGGRGFIDDDDPGFLTTVSLIFAEKLQDRLDSIDAFVKRNEGFDRVKLDAREQALRLAEMDPKSRDQLRTIAGREAVDRRVAAAQSVFPTEDAPPGSTV